MAPRKIAILGGGMAALSAAWQLTATPALRAVNQVTVYQLGWRLGGKAASGRDAADRNLEHGLHVWFGFYENTFALIQALYAARQPATGWAMPTWQDAVKPQNFTPIGTQDAAGNWSYWPLTWPTNDGVPGEGNPLPTWTEALETVADWIWLFLTGHEGPSPAHSVALAGPPPLVAAAATPRSAVDAARQRIGSDVDAAIALLGWARDVHSGLVAQGASPNSSDGMIHAALDIFVAVFKGVFADLIIPDAPLRSLDGTEFRAWLVKHGADPVIVATSSIVRVAYDTMYQYHDGDATRPDLAAGTGLGAVTRMVALFKGSMMWEVQAGMGEVIVGPLYQQLVANGVNFAFFHKVTGLEPDPADPGAVGTIMIDVQAATTGAPYAPVTVRNGMVLWPSEPYWNQLQNGTAMQTAGINFESNWCSWQPVAQVTLQRGTDFDDVVLAIALGALKQLNPEDASMCAPLLPHSPALANWIANVDIAANLGVQLWCEPTTAGLGWTQAKPATVSGPEYLDIWADMTQVLAFEHSPLPKAQSLHYLTGTYETTLYRAPRSQTDTPALAKADLRAQTIAWLNTYGGIAWPAARANGGFDWNVLHSPAGTVGEARLDAQYIRANVDPTECTTLSAAGTTQYRLGPDKSGFTNLFLAGEGTDMSLPTCFEGAVMSGMAASRAICGSPALIPGYDFLDRRPSQGFGP